MLNTALKTSSKSQNYTDMTLLTCWAVELREKLWKRRQGRLQKEGKPLGGVLVYESEVLVCCTRTCYDPASLISNLTITTRTDGTTERTEDEGLGANIWCCSASAFCQTGELELSLIVPLSERNSTGWAGQPRSLWPREEQQLTSLLGAGHHVGFK